MTRRSILIAVVLVCLTITLSLSPNGFFSKSALAEKGEGAGIQELPLGIQKIHLKGNKVYITIVRTGGGKIDPGDYSKIKMKVDPGSGKPLRQWSLTDVDRNKALSAASGKIEFDTGIVLEKGETVKAILSFGKWETSKQEVLSLTTATALAKTAPSKMMAQDKMATTASRRKVTPRLDDSGGIRIIRPTSGQTQRPGDRVPVIFTMLREVGTGMVEIALKKFGATETFATIRIGYNPAVGEITTSTSMTLPTRGLPPGSNYYLSAIHPEAWGLSDAFSIESPGEGLIRVTQPRAGDGVTPGFAMTVGYQFTRRVGEGVIHFELYGMDADGRHGRPLLTRSSHYRPGPAGTPDPIHLMDWQLPPDLAVGQYFILATHPEAWGKSSNFFVQWERTGTAFPSDYAVVNIFKQGNDFKARLRATGGDIADSVEISVNGEIRREIIRPASDTVIIIRPVDYGREGCGVVHEVTIDPNNTFREENKANNTLRKFVPIEDPDGYAKVVEDLDSRGRLLIQCGEVRDHGVMVSVRNCSSEPARVFVTAQQVGWRNIMDPATYFIRDRRVYSVAGVGIGEPIPPGHSMRVSVRSEDLGNIDSTLVFNFSGDGVSRWRHLTNPLNVPVRFGRSGTIIDLNTGTRRTTCEYVDW
jgi:hypothetical protein